MSSTALKNFWLKIVAKLPKLLPRRQEIKDVELEPVYVPTALDKRLAKEIKRREAKGEAKAVDTRKGGPNMPRYQNCRQCGRPAKRTRKEMGGAHYKCPVHGSFFVESKVKW